MITTLATKIVETIWRSLAIKETEKDLYIYGFFILISRTLNLVIVLLCGIIFNVLFESILFYVVFSILRSYAGGIHSKTENSCTVLTNLTMFSCTISIKILKSIGAFSISVVMIIIGTVAISILSPQSSSEKPLEEEEHWLYRHLSRRISLICFQTAILAYIIGWHGVLISLATSVFLEGLLLIVGKIANFFDSNQRTRS